MTSKLLSLREPPEASFSKNARLVFAKYPRGTEWYSLVLQSEGSVELSSSKKFHAYANFRLCNKYLFCPQTFIPAIISSQIRYQVFMNSCIYLQILKSCLTLLDSQILKVQYNIIITFKTEDIPRNKYSNKLKLQFSCRTIGKVQVLFFRRFLLALTKFSFREKE